MAHIKFSQVGITPEQQRRLQEIEAGLPEQFHQQPGTRDLTLQEGTPASFLDLGRRQSGQIGDSSSYQKFGLALMNMLKDFQQLGTRKFEEAELAGREAAAERVLARTPEELIGAAPGVQRGVRAAQVGALEPQIAGELKQTFSEQLRAFGSSLEQARAIGTFLLSEEREQQKQYRDVVFAAPLALLEMSDKEKRELAKRAGLSVDALDALAQQARKEQEFELETLRTKQTGAATITSIDNWLNLLSTGQISLSQVPTDLRDAVVKRSAELGIPIISPTFAGKRADAIQAFNSANALLDLIGTQALQLITAENLSERILKGGKLSIESFLQTDPRATAYKTTKDAFLSMLTRAAGEKGVLTTQDVQRIKKALPDFTDTREVAERKLNNLRGLFESIRTGGIEAFTPGIQKGGSSGQTSGGIKYEIIP